MFSKDSSKKKFFDNKKFLDQIDEGSENFSQDKLEKMTAGELEEILMFLNPDENSREFNLVQEVYKSIKRPKIELASLRIRIASSTWQFLIILFTSILFMNLGDSVITFIKSQKNLLASGVSTTPENEYSVFLFFLAFLGWVVFLAWFESRNVASLSGSSLFRRSIRLITVNKDGKTISWSASFLRHLLKFFPLLNLLLIIFMELSKDKRGLHNKLIGAYVLRLNDEVNSGDLTSFIYDQFLFKPQN